MPKAVEDAGPEAIAAWAIETGEKYRQEHFPDFKSIVISLDEEKDNG